MQILIADKTAPECRRTLETYEGVQVVEKSGMDPTALLDAVASCEALIVRSATKVTTEVIAAARGLRVIGRAGAGVDNIDVQAASDRDIVVMNTPGGNAAAAAELTLGLMLSVARHIPRADASMKKGKWARKELSGTELGGKTLGLLGLGHVGGRVSRLAGCLGMDVVAYDPFFTPEQAREVGARLAERDEVLATSDYISIHAPRTPQTAGTVNADAFGRMKDGVRLINCSRGGIVVEGDLLDALESGKVAGAGIDVFESEPPEDTALASHPRVVATPHIGASSAEAQVKVAVMIADQVGVYLTRGEITNAVNR